MDFFHDSGSSGSPASTIALNTFGFRWVSNMMWHVGQSINKLFPPFLPSAIMCALCLTPT